MSRLNPDLARGEKDPRRRLTGPPVFWPLILALRSFAHLAAGHHASALALIDEAIAAMAGNPVFSAGFWELRGSILRESSAEPAETEASYRKAVEEARQSGLWMIELQARNALTRLLRELGRDDEIDELRTAYQSIQGGDDESEMLVAAELLG